jgi:hypothetical protein
LHHPVDLHLIGNLNLSRDEAVWNWPHCTAPCGRPVSRICLIQVFSLDQGLLHLVRVIKDKPKCTASSKRRLHNAVNMLVTRVAPLHKIKSHEKIRLKGKNRCKDSFVPEGILQGISKDGLYILRTDGASLHRASDDYITLLPKKIRVFRARP